jgi:hypothetical protein
MARSHLDRIALVDPAVAARARLLDPDGRDVPDPFGGPLAEYETARDQIARALQARLPEILALAE